MTYDLAWYRDLRAKVIAAGFAHELDWSEMVGPPPDPEAFVAELIYVICNSGMKQQVARRIYDKVAAALRDGGSAGEAFRHTGKARSIDHLWKNQDELYDQYMRAADKLAFLAGIDWIGPITKYHAARNFGLDLVKPDRHLQRVADAAGEAPQALCERLADASGDRVGTVDLVIWRAANLGLIRTLAIDRGQQGLPF